MSSSFKLDRTSVLSDRTSKIGPYGCKRLMRPPTATWRRQTIDNMRSFRPASCLGGGGGALIMMFLFLVLFLDPQLQRKLVADWYVSTERRPDLGQSVSS